MQIAPEGNAVMLISVLAVEFEITANDCEGPLPQALLGVTVIFPLPAPTVTVTELVVPPPVCVQPPGNVQLYVTPLVNGTEYDWLVPKHGELSPVIAPGCNGTVVGVTANVLAVPEKQMLLGVTVIFPLLLPTVTVTELVVPPPVCVQPEGKLQVYMVPATLVTLYVWDVPTQGAVGPVIMEG